MKNLFPFLLIILMLSCKKSDPVSGGTTPPPVTPPVIPPTSEAYYFPPLTGDAWTTKSASSIGWDSVKLQEAFDYAATKATYGLIVLQNRRIVKEQYWNGWTKDTRYYIASAGKSVVGFVAGIAQQNGLINIDNKTSAYLGTGWTSLPIAKENLITLKNQLTMTTGLDDNVPDVDCTDPSCLIYKADAGTRWAYHNAPYHLIQKLLGVAAGTTFNAYCKTTLFDKIGMPNAFWFNYIMYCTTREAARFGSLILQKGKWDGNTLLSDTAYYHSMINTSQNYNKSYGYLWWLNGKSSFMLPTLQTIFPGYLNTSAPADMFMALGKDDKKIYIVPSLNAVVVRLGDDAGGSTAGPSSFDTEFWGKLKPAMNY